VLAARTEGLAPSSRQSWARGPTRPAHGPLYLLDLGATGSERLRGGPDGRPGGLGAGASAGDEGSGYWLGLQSIRPPCSTASPRAQDRLSEPWSPSSRPPRRGAGEPRLLQALTKGQKSRLAVETAQDRRARVRGRRDSTSAAPGISASDRRVIPRDSPGLRTPRQRAELPVCLIVSVFKAGALSFLATRPARHHEHAPEAEVAIVEMPRCASADACGAACGHARELTLEGFARLYRRGSRQRSAPPSSRPGSSRRAFCPGLDRRAAVPDRPPAAGLHPHGRAAFAKADRGLGLASSPAPRRMPPRRRALAQSSRASSTGGHRQLLSRPSGSSSGFRICARRDRDERPRATARNRSAPRTPRARAR